MPDMEREAEERNSQRVLFVFPSIYEFVQSDLDIVEFALTFQACLDSVAAILGVTEEHLRAGHVEHGVGYVG